MTRPLATLRVAAKTATQWDSSRAQVLHPTGTNDDGSLVVAAWSEFSGTGETERQLLIAPEDLPAWMERLGQAYADHIRVLSKESVAERVDSARRDGYKSGFRAGENRMIVQYEAARLRAEKEAAGETPAEAPEEAS